MKFVKINNSVLGENVYLLDDSVYSELLVELHRTEKLLDYDLVSVDVESIEQLEELLDANHKVIRPAIEIKDWITRLENIKTPEKTLAFLTVDGENGDLR